MFGKNKIYTVFRANTWTCSSKCNVIEAKIISYLKKRNHKYTCSVAL